MNERHFIWIVPLILLIGFVIGYISGLNIPKEVVFRMDNLTSETIKYIMDASIYTQNNTKFACNPYFTGKQYPDKCLKFYINSSGNYCDGELVCQN